MAFWVHVDDAVGATVAAIEQRAGGQFNIADDEPARASVWLPYLAECLFSVAYRILGAVGDAEDVVQDAWVRWQRALDDGVRPASPKAYLSAVITRLAIDELRSARAPPERHVGE